MSTNIVTEYRATDSEDAYAVAKEIADKLRGEGERVVTVSWFGEIFVYRFDDLTEDEVLARLDDEHDLLAIEKADTW